MNHNNLFDPFKISVTAGKKPRDLRLDFFRGLTMMIIFIAHVHDNPWDRYIPARFGFSSGAELFVFCSGLASAIAFGSVFVSQGYFMGLARIVQRIWQIYFAHIGLFMVILTISIVAVTQNIGNGTYYSQIGLEVLLGDPQRWLPGILGLYYVPDLLNILPMYIVLLSFVPVAMLLAKIHKGLVALLSVGLWLSVQVWHFNLSAGPPPDWLWFFNPFAWQLIFFTGFGFGMGWLPAPPFASRRMFAVVMTLVVLAIPVTFWGFTENVPQLAALGEWLSPGNATTELRFARYAHFLCVAYCVLALVNPRQYLLTSRSVSWIVTIGRQSLACFLTSLTLSWIGGIVLDIYGRTALPVLLVNVSGLALLYSAACIVSWYRKTPWKAAPVKQASTRIERPEAQGESVAAPVSMGLPST